jgi:hypothetical protein
MRKECTEGPRGEGAEVTNSLINSVEVGSYLRENLWISKELPFMLSQAISLGPPATC